MCACVCADTLVDKMRFDICIDGFRNSVQEVNVLPAPPNKNPYGGEWCFVASQVRDTQRRSMPKPQRSAESEKQCATLTLGETEVALALLTQPSCSLESHQQPPHQSRRQ